MVTTQITPQIATDGPSSAASSKTQSDKAGQTQNEKIRKVRPGDHWPRSMREAYQRIPGPYTIKNTWFLLEEEPLELFNGWLVWQPVTDAIERRIAGNIQEILSLAGRAANFGQAYPDQFECKMANGDVLKPDACLISHDRFERQVTPVLKNGTRFVLSGGPELVVEARSRSNRRPKERLKRQTYFENGTLVVWDVAPLKHKITVYEVENPEQGREYGEADEITCERLLPGWRRKVADFFAARLSAEEVVGQAAVQWRAESRELGLTEGRKQGLNEGEQIGREHGLAEGEQIGREQGLAEGELLALRKILVRQAQRRFGVDQLPADLEARLSKCNTTQLTELADNLALNLSLAEWLGLL